MAKIAYEDWKPGPAAEEAIRRATQIAQEYAAQGYDLTLRQLYYQFVSRGFIANRDTEYKKLGEQMNRARMAGMFDWDYITDRTRNIHTLGHWETPEDIIEAAARSYQRDRWANQPNRIEVWVEKEALAGVIGQVADRHDVSYFSCRGYVSQSEQWGAAQRLRRYIEAGQKVTVLHLGDHDPSGLDMTRDIRDRITTFIYRDLYNRTGSGTEAAKVFSHLDINRIALNIDQVRQYDPPPNPAKLTDSRSDKYVEEFGDESWELDALDPATLDALIEEHILELRDDDLWREMEARESDERTALTETQERWDEVKDFLGV